MRNTTRLQLTHVAHQRAGCCNGRHITFVDAESFDRCYAEVSRDFSRCKLGIELPRFALGDESTVIRKALDRIRRIAPSEYFARRKPRHRCVDVR